MMSKKKSKTKINIYTSIVVRVWCSGVDLPSSPLQSDNKTKNMIIIIAIFKRKLVKKNQ